MARVRCLSVLDDSDCMIYPYDLTLSMEHQPAWLCQLSNRFLLCLLLMDLTFHSVVCMTPVPGLVLHWKGAAQSRHLKRVERSLQEDTHDFRSALDSFGMEETVLAVVLGDSEA